MDSLPVSGYKVLQLQQPVFTVLHHFLCVQVLHQARQDPARNHTHTHLSFKAFATVILDVEWMTTKRLSTPLSVWTSRAHIVS